MRSHHSILQPEWAFSAFLAVLLTSFSPFQSLAQSAATYDTGIRFELKKGQKFPVVAQVWAKSPAAEAGAKVGETLWQLDGATVEGLSITEISTRLNGEGSKHSLQLGAEKREIKLKSAKIKGECLSGNCKSGRGAWLEPDGSKYEGDFAAGRFHGKGTMAYPSGNRHEGQYLDGKRSGAGKFNFANGTVYEGNFENNDFDGAGKLRHKSGETYEGDFHADLRQGKGTATYPTGDRYEGDWADDQKHGQGQFQAADGSNYDGAWSMGKRNGFGKQISFEGWTYEGNWQDDERAGFGKLTTATGDRVEGTFSANALPSTGKVFFVDGKKYDGQLFDGKPHGYGRCELLGGHLFEGNFADGQPKTGVLALASGSKKEVQIETWAELQSKSGGVSAASSAPKKPTAPVVGSPKTDGSGAASPTKKEKYGSAEQPVAYGKTPPTNNAVAEAKAILEGREGQAYDAQPSRYLKGSTSKRLPEQTAEESAERLERSYAYAESGDENGFDEQPQPASKRRNASPRTVSDDGLSPEAREALSILDDGQQKAIEKPKKGSKAAPATRQEAEKRPMPSGSDKNSAEKKRLLLKVDGFFDHVRTSENWLTDNSEMIGKARVDNLRGLSSMASAWAASAANFRESFPNDLKIPNRIAAIDSVERFLETNRKLAMNFQKLAFLSAEWLGSKDPEKEAQLTELRLQIEDLKPQHEARFEAARKAIL